MTKASPGRKARNPAKADYLSTRFLNKYNLNLNSSNFNSQHYAPRGDLL
jgi:hypothetical protein